jgi:hypothetical protein
MRSLRSTSASKSSQLSLRLSSPMFTCVSNGTIEILIASRLGEAFSRVASRSRTAFLSSVILFSDAIEPVLSSTSASSILFCPQADSPAAVSLIESIWKIPMIAVLMLPVAATRIEASVFTTSTGPIWARALWKFRQPDLGVFPVDGMGLGI